MNQPGQFSEGKTAEWEKIRNIEAGELAIFTDGSLKGGKAGFGIAAYTARSREEGRMEQEEAASMEEKDIMDAETWAIIRALHIANRTAKKIRIFTDSRTAKDWILNPRKEGHLAYMWESLCEATKENGSEIEISWVKGQAGNKGNERANALARKGGEKIDPWEGKSHEASTHEISEKRNREWKKWFGEKEHYYKRQPRRKLRHLKGLSREDTAAVFYIHRDKGWGKTAVGKDDDREQRECGEKMSSDYVLTCAKWEDGRPTTNPQQDRYRWALARWAKKQDYFGIPPRYYPVR